MIAARLIKSGLCDAAKNMAIDEALFSSYKEKTSLPVLRVYGWSPAAFSLGCNQKPQELLNIFECEKAGIPIVKRPTGGGLIFHDDELTYSIVLCQDDLGVNRRVKESFEKITSFLFCFYKNLGAKACFAKDVNPASGSHTIAPICFSRSEEYDILVNGKKIGGNAQKRRRSVILQHGSIPFSFSKEKISRFLKNPDMVCGLDVNSLKDITTREICFDEMSQNLIDAFSCHFKLDLKATGLSPEEKKISDALIKKAVLA
ncbi:MAG TPA: lipoate--protein ligase family protein [Candidatus Omnitrophota bacterium]|nr:lipoate--protein ligase family protein [Candidatus Omnitrophota bacterium]